MCVQFECVCRSFVPFLEKPYCPLVVVCCVTSSDWQQQNSRTLFSRSPVRTVQVHVYAHLCCSVSTPMPVTYIAHTAPNAKSHEAKESEREREIQMKRATHRRTNTHERKRTAAATLRSRTRTFCSKSKAYILYIHFVPTSAECCVVNISPPLHCSTVCVRIPT